MYDECSLLNLLKGLPSSVKIRNLTVTCHGVTAAVDETVVDEDTILTFQLYEDDLLIYTINGTKNSSVVFPLELFVSQTTNYSITLIPENPAGKGPATRMDIPSNYCKLFRGVVFKNNITCVIFF